LDPNHKGINNITSAYKQLGIFDDTLYLFLADNGGTNQDGGFNVPLRGQKGEQPVPNFFQVF
jgi:arylsulfatase A-like enzyme